MSQRTHDCNCNPCKCRHTESERRKVDALATLAERREVYVNRARRALLLALLDGSTATIDDVRFAVELPAGIDPKCFGVVPGTLARAGIIRADGYDRTCRPEGHARPVTIWRLADPAAAERWLIAHPDQPDPADDDQADATQGFLFPAHTTNEPTPMVAATGAGMEE